MTFEEIDSITRAKYAYGILEIGPLPALWVADHILSLTGKNVFSIIFQLREAAGLTTVTPQYGTRLWETWKPSE